jgi:O-succinylbenzoic acid--CoA ligase
VLLTEADPEKFLAGFLAACIARCPLVLGNPRWMATELQQAMAIARPHLLWGAPSRKPVPKYASSLKPGWILIPTGGSSGNLKFAIHTWETLVASVQGFQAYFQVAQVNSCCVLPLYHVGGLMQFLRSFTTGGTLAVLPFKSLLNGELPDLALSQFFLSLVPTQLQRLLGANQAGWLTQFSSVLLGGGPAWPDLLAQARGHKICLAPTYGMTETASQVATLKPADFLQGKSGVGQVLPHSEIRIGDHPNDPCPAGQTGTIWIRSTSLALGYMPEQSADLNCQSGFYQTRDLGCLEADGYLQVVGRSDRTIITGGENVCPEEVEAAIRRTGLVGDVCVLGLPDADWGERVTAAYVPIRSQITPEDLQGAVSPLLSAYKRPKQWMAVASLPRNAQGKVNYNTLRTMLLHGRPPDRPHLW